MGDGWHSHAVAEEILMKMRKKRTSVEATASLGFMVDLLISQDEPTTRLEKKDLGEDG